MKYIVKGSAGNPSQLLSTSTLDAFEFPAFECSASLNRQLSFGLSNTTRFSSDEDKKSCFEPETSKKERLGLATEF